MEIIVFMLLISLSLGLGFLWAFLWANKNKQFDDLVSPAMRAVFEDTKVTTKGESNGEKV